MVCPFCVSTKNSINVWKINCFSNLLFRSRLRCRALYKLIFFAYAHTNISSLFIARSHAVPRRGMVSSQFFSPAFKLLPLTTHADISLAT